MVSLVSSIHQGLGDLCVVRTFSKKEEERTELGREREETEKRQRERESRERKRVCECVCGPTTLHNTTLHVNVTN
ncbi:hypothetical protein D8674_024887 [Pyrus ussuriensis x Pyrus communis]|uniref:Uncharacterized protein n=1 Tax=Pyrus ussuriensis x Pyrus communis TaxID=2448454 RepID=A0A5N5H459_9ROSA|nr:hypothetical protein D8674_024886 [Pyrus ussuriensis x Pyrus communis]KAB2622705.1 hypothetical protein D8674_024887 [Pyrus ussuriensis x Pyrus communis]